MKALVISHIPFEGMGTIGIALIENGVSVEHHYAHRIDMRAVDIAAHDIAVFMGGPMGVYQSDMFSWITDELDYLSKRMAANLPTLGICLGSQLMAQALGSSVRKGSNGFVYAFHPVRATPEGRALPTRHFDEAQTMVMHSHGDTYDLPEGCTWLLQGHAYPMQGFCKTPRQIGLQFHPEATPQSLEEWLMMGDFTLAERACGSVSNFRTEAQTQVPIMAQQTKSFVADWLAMLKE